MPDASTTAIVGVGNIGSALARHLSRGGESLVLAAKDSAHAEALANELGALVRTASVEAAIANADAIVFALWLDVLKEVIPSTRACSKGRSSLIRRIRSASTARATHFVRSPKANPRAQSSPA